MSKPKLDQLHRFIFSDANIRGELVQLKDSYQSVLESHPYPLAIQQLLGEMMLATSLLTATLKFKGEISFQIQSEGSLKYAVVSGTHDQQMRAIARFDQSISDQCFAELVDNKGTLAITIMPEKGQQYQGIVALDKPSLAECLEGYFQQSEQLATKVVLHTRLNGDEPVAAGILLQVIPESDISHQNQNESFEHLSQLTQTITCDELVELPVGEILHRLYHQEDVHLYEPVPVTFSCTCSREKIATALAGIPREELWDILQEKGSIVTNCHYCLAEYQFSAQDIEEMFTEQIGNPDIKH